MGFISEIVANFTQPAMLFFILGLIAVAVKSDLEIPPGVSKFLSMYLLFHIGIKGGEELFHSGLSSESLVVLLVCAFISFATPWLLFYILKVQLNTFDAGAVAAAYGSISAVNFIAATSILDSSSVAYNGYMVAAMALMESPAVIAGLMIIGLNTKEEGGQSIDFKHVLHEALFNGSVFLLLGSLLIGFMGGEEGAAQLHPFVHSIFKGLLCFYMLDMGLLAAKKVSKIKGHVLFCGSFSILYPLVFCAIAVVLARFMNLNIGNAYLFTVLVTSSSFIAVPASMRMAVPKANMGILLAMSLGITFVVNIIFGAALYLPVIKYFWSITGGIN